jgi:hypothetical protein
LADFAAQRAGVAISAGFLMIKAVVTVLCVACALPASGMRVAESDGFDVELVLAVDVSRSMDDAEFSIQRRGYAEALRHPDFINAVKAGPHGRILISYFEWSGAARPESLVDWAVVDGPESAAVFANQIENRPEVGSRYGTSISSAIDFAAGLIVANAVESERKVIDVSGDGPNNMGRLVTEARDDAVAQGIVINGLPMLVSAARTFRDLDRYYANCVIGGPGAFVLPVNDAAEFATAIRRKLVLELSGLPSELEATPAADGDPIDCTSEDERDPRFPHDGNAPANG